MLKKLFSFFKSEPKTSRLHETRILVVEDNPVDQKVICNIIKTMNYQVFTAENGEEGVKVARAINPHLIIMDCDMPVMNGWDATRILKESPTTKNIPVVFLTSINTPKNVIDCFELDAENYLSKPISAKILRAQIPLILKDFSNF